MLHIEPTMVGERRATLRNVVGGSQTVGQCSVQPSNILIVSDLLRHVLMFQLQTCQ